MEIADLPAAVPLLVSAPALNASFREQLLNPWPRISARSAAIAVVWNDKAPAGATYEGNIYDMNTQGQIKLCFFNDDTINRARTQDEIQALYNACPTGNLAIIAYTDPIPNTPLAVRGSLPASFKAALKASLLDVKNHPDLVAKINEWYVDPTQEKGLKNLDAFYDPLRVVAKILDLDLKSMK